MVTDEHVHRDGLNNNIQSDVPLIMYLVEDTRENICDLVAASNELKQDNMKCLLDYFVAEIEKVLLTMWAVNSSSLANQYSETRSAQLLACVHWVAMCTVSASDATSLCQCVGGGIPNLFGILILVCQFIALVYTHCQVQRSTLFNIYTWATVASASFELSA